MYHRSIKDSDNFWRDIAMSTLRWLHPFTKVQGGYVKSHTLEQSKAKQTGQHQVQHTHSGQGVLCMCACMCVLQRHAPRGRRELVHQRKTQRV